MRGYLYILGLTLAKLSLLLFLYRIFKVDLTFRVLSWIVGIVLVIWTTVSLLLSIFACKPIKASWVLSVQLDPATKCPIKAYDVNNIHGYCNIITDFALLLMPAPSVWKLHVNGKRKFGVFIVFGTGVLYVFPLRRGIPGNLLTRSVVSASFPLYGNTLIIIPTRTGMIITLESFESGVSLLYPFLLLRSAQDTSLTNLRHLLVSLEFSFSIIVACLPVITPLLKKLSVLSTWFPRFRSRLGGSKGRQKELEMVRDQEVERGAVRHEHDPPVSWKVPAAWNEPAPQAYPGQDDVNQGSDLTLQDLRSFGDDKEKNTNTAKV